MHDLSLLKMASQQGLTFSPQRWTSSIRNAENMSLESIESHISAAMSCNVKLFESEAEKRMFINSCVSEMPGPRIARRRLKKIMSRIKQARRVLEIKSIESSSFETLANKFLYPMHGDGPGDGTKLWWRRWLPRHRKDLKADKEESKMIRREVRLCLMNMCSTLCSSATTRSTVHQASTSLEHQRCSNTGTVVAQHKAEIKEHKRKLRLEDRERRRHIREKKLIAKILTQMTKKVDRMIRKERLEKERANRPKVRRGRRKHGELSDRESRVPKEKWPSWLPEGWFATEVPRQNTSASKSDMYFYHEKSWSRCRSKPEVFRKIAALKLKAIEKQQKNVQKSVANATKMMGMMIPPPPPPHVMSQMMTMPGLMNMMMMNAMHAEPPTKKRKKMTKKKKKKEEEKKKKETKVVDGEVGEKKTTTTTTTKKKKTKTKRTKIKRSERSTLENLLIRRASSEGEEVKIVSSENEKKIASENNQKLKVVVSENDKSVSSENNETSKKKRKKEEEETTTSTTSPKKKKAKIEVPVVDSNDAEAVNRLTQRCVEFVNLSRRENLTEETQQNLRKICVTLNLQTPTYEMLKSTGIGLAVRKLRKNESISDSLRKVLNGIYKRWKRKYFSNNSNN